MAPLRAELYQALADALAEPAESFALSGTHWLLTNAARNAAHVSPAASRAVDTLARIPAETLTRRKQRYAALFHGPCLPLYESMHREGRLLTQTTRAVERLYRVAGLEVDGSELPDHASLELAFLGYLAQQQVEDQDRSRRWRRIERGFIRRHAGMWLPDLGRGLVAEDDEVYAPIGRLLTGVLAEAINPLVSSRAKAAATSLPVLIDQNTCTLCGFCVQVCPTHSLAVDESANLTRLILNPAACTGCQKCESVCTPRTLKMRAMRPNHEWVVLNESPRLSCPSCRIPTVSQAEFNFVVDQIGNAPWLAYCPACRSGHMETI